MEGGYGASIPTPELETPASVGFLLNTFWLVGSPHEYQTFPLMDGSECKKSWKVIQQLPQQRKKLNREGSLDQATWDQNLMDQTQQNSAKF